jgi:cobalt-zinc-cadmium efflux system outer membrane protein
MRLYRSFWFFFISPLAFASEGQPLSLDAAVEQALARAPQVTASQAGVEAAQALATSAGRLPDPSLIVGIDNLPVNGRDAYSTTADFMTMRKVGVVQQFPRADKRRLQHARAQAGADLAEAELTRSRLDVARKTAQAWIRVATTNAALERLRTLQAEVELDALAARANLAAGRGSSADALAAESAVARLKNRLLQFQGEVRAAQADLSRWIGDAALVPLAPLPSFEDLPVPVETVISNAHLHGDLLPFEARLTAARADVELARAERRPDWAAEISFARRGPDFSDMASIQFTIGLPLFSKYRQDPVIRARGASLRQIEAERESEIRMHTAELQGMVIEWQQLGEQLAQYRNELLPLARERSQVALASYRAGGADLRGSIEAFSDEIDLLIEAATLQNQRGQAWASLRYLEAQHVHVGTETTP